VKLRFARRRISEDQGAPAPYCVTVVRRGVSPLKLRLLVRGTSGQMAGELAAWMAERDRGGMFEPVTIRRTSRRPADEFDDADFWPTRAPYGTE
jgi:hypothetical protein